MISVAIWQVSRHPWQITCPESAKAKVEDTRAPVLETRLRYQLCEKRAARELCSKKELDTYTAAHSRAPGSYRCLALRIGNSRRQ